MLEMIDGCHHVLLRENNRYLQLAVSGANFLRPVQLRTDAIWPSKHMKHRMWALECLNYLCMKGEFPARLFPVEKRSQRLCFVLRALDGALADASHRQIAEALIGEERVRTDWAEPGENLRDRTRRAIRRGRALMEGGYKDFLV
ncbi:DNA -binding domain-containing protein [Pelagibacterium sp.]|uniref:DNA -binding domain-containing protein n=1 Tax=Pelagibacterium sp. TaxID=1967288 RepID=UPI003BA9BE78